MKYRCFITCIICILLISAVPLWAAGEAQTPDAAKKTADEAANPDTAYIVGPGDVLDISVWKDEALTRSVAVLPDGKIYFPLIGEVQAGGRNVLELKKDIEKRFSSYVPELILHLDVRQVNSMLIYVIGRVNNPGRLTLNANINILQALAAAGGLNPFAARSKIKIFRQEGPETKTFKFDYDDVSNGSHLEQNIILKRGDVIVVP